METFITVFSAIWCVCAVLLIYRMWEAHKMRIGIMKDDLDKYMRLPSYSEMVFKFWRPLSFFVSKASEDAPHQVNGGQD